MVVVENETTSLHDFDQFVKQWVIGLIFLENIVKMFVPRAIEYVSSSLLCTHRHISWHFFVSFFYSHPHHHHVYLDVLSLIGFLRDVTCSQ
jgi:hypothetical protein